MALAALAELTVLTGGRWPTRLLVQVSWVVLGICGYGLSREVKSHSNHGSPPLGWIFKLDLGLIIT